MKNLKSYPINENEDTNKIIKKANKFGMRIPVGYFITYITHDSTNGVSAKAYSIVSTSLEGAIKILAEKFNVEKKFEYGKDFNDFFENYQNFCEEIGERFSEEIYQVFELIPAIEPDQFFECDLSSQNEVMKMGNKVFTSFCTSIANKNSNDY